MINFVHLLAEPPKTSIVNRKRPLPADTINKDAISKGLSESPKVAKKFKDDDDDFFIEANHDDNDDPGKIKIFVKSCKSHIIQNNKFHNFDLS